MDIFANENEPLEVTNNSNGAFSITGSQLQVDLNGDGNYTNVSNGSEVAENANVRLTINWSLADDLNVSILSNPTVLENLPSCFYVPATGMTGVIKGQGNLSNVTFATYTISSDHKIEIHWNVNVLNYDGIAGKLSIQTQFRFENSDEDVVIDLSQVGGDEIVIHSKEDGEAKIQKKGLEYNKDTGEMTWEIKVNDGSSGHQALSNVVIYDTFGNNQDFVRATLYKKEKNENDWSELESSNYTQEVTNGEVSWTILPKNTLKSTAYKVVVKTHITDDDVTKIRNKASFTSKQNESKEEVEGEFDLVHSEFSKEIDKQNGTEKIEYFLSNGTPSTKSDYDYALIYWTIKVYYPIDFSKNNPIEDMLTISPSEAGTHKYVTSSVVINACDNQSAAQKNFTVSFANSDTKMTITPPVAPNYARRGYEIKYVSKFTKTQAQSWYNGKTIHLGNQATYADFSDQDGGYITPTTDFGVTKNGVNSNSEKQTMAWRINYNTQGVNNVKNGKIIDNYIVYREDLMNSHPDELNSIFYNKYKWIYFKRELIEDTLVVKLVPSNTVLRRGIDYTLSYKNLDDEHLLLPDGSTLYSGLDFKSGFVIEFLGSYKESLSSQVEVTFETKEHIMENKGYLRSWDMTNEEINDWKDSLGLWWQEGEIYKWQGADKFYDFTYDSTHNDPYNPFLNPDLHSFNGVEGRWGENGEFSQRDVGITWFSWLDMYNDSNGVKQAVLLPAGRDLSSWETLRLGQSDSGYKASLKLFYYLKYNGGYISADQSDVEGIYKGFSSEDSSVIANGYTKKPVVAFTTTFNPFHSTLPAGTVFTDDLSHLEVGEVEETTFELIKNSIRIYESKEVSDNGRNYLHTNGTEQKDPANTIFKEGIDYEIDYNEETKLLKINFLKTHDKTLNIVFLMSLSHETAYSKDPLLNGKFQNTAKLTTPNQSDMTASTGEVQFDRNGSLYTKTMTAGEGEESNLGFYTVVVNPNNFKFQQLLVSDATDKTAMSLIKGADGEPILKVYEGVRDVTGQLIKGKLLTAGVDYLQIPSHIIATMGGNHGDYTLPDEYGKIIRYWDFNQLDVNGRPKIVEDDFHTLADIPANLAWDYGGSYSPIAGQFNADTLLNMTSRPREPWQILFGENRAYTNEEPRDDRTFIIDYAVKIDGDKLPAGDNHLYNYLGINLRDAEEAKVGGQVEKPWSESSGEGSGYNHELTFAKKNAKGDLLAGASFMLEKKMGDTWQSIYPTNALGAFDVNETITRAGLTNGLYRLVELKAPVGYQKLSEPIYFRQMSLEEMPNFYTTDEVGNAKENSFASFSTENGEFTLNVQNDYEKRPLTIEKTWDFTNDNILVNEDDLEFYVVKVDVLREVETSLGTFTLDRKIASLELTHENSFKEVIENLPVKTDDGVLYRYVAKEVDIIDSRNGKSILVNFTTEGMLDNLLDENHDLFDTDNRLVTDSNGNFLIGLKNVLTPKSEDDYVKVGFEKFFIATPDNYVSHITLELFRKTEESGYHYIQTITLNKENSWKWASGLLSKKDVNGMEYQYFIKETAVYDKDENNIMDEFLSSAEDYTALTSVSFEVDEETFKSEYLDVYNTYQRSLFLPETGGNGLKWIMVATSIMLALSVVLYRLRKWIRLSEVRLKR